MIVLKEYSVFTSLSRREIAHIKRDVSSDQRLWISLKTLLYGILSLQLTMSNKSRPLESGWDLILLKTC